MTLALDTLLLLYTLQTLKENDGDQCSSSVDKNDKSTPVSSILRALPTEPVSIPALVNAIHHPPPNTPPLYVTSIEWRAAPKDELHHEYVVMHVSTAPQTSPIVSVRVDRYGSLGVKVPWWRRPARLSPGTKRASTTAVAGSIDDNIADPPSGTSVIRYRHWTQEIPAEMPAILSIAQYGHML
ncbi:pre-mRNA-splicing factor SPP [Ceratobasidium sp. AG-Ba]|nr:pre-mRNA-splicing factor SPP [Ceratobasidium sp. AG-Ba]QRW05146.1 pre-mRNA-splicing factor SPP [Ceratobasidium sp. AG-Ba]